MKNLSWIVLLVLCGLFVTCSEAEEEVGTVETGNNEEVNTVEDSLQTEELNLPASVQDNKFITNNAANIMGDVTGDLDKDGIAERVIVFETDRAGEDGFERDLIVYKAENDVWTEWKKSSTAILGSEGGGMMGDPFQAVSIENGLIITEHFGGSSWKWNELDKYRFQDGEFYLIGHTSTYGKPCEYWSDVDYNLSTGDITYDFEIDDCEEEGYENMNGPNKSEKFNHKLEKLPSMENRSHGAIEFKTPKHAATIYI